jgi:AraC family transcriptional regulator
LAKPVHHCSFDDDLIRYTILEMLSECAVDSTVSPLLMDSAGYHVAAHLFARYSGALRQTKATGMAQWKLRRALDYIEENIDRDIGLEELSKTIDTSPHYFCRAFRKSVGMPPYRYLINRRIERSKELLVSTAEPKCIMRGRPPSNRRWRYHHRG